MHRAPLFQLVMMPLRSLLMIASSDDEMIAARKFFAAFVCKVGLPDCAAETCDWGKAQDSGTNCSPDSSDAGKKLLVFLCFCEAFVLSVSALLHFDPMCLFPQRPIHGHGIVIKPMETSRKSKLRLKCLRAPGRILLHAIDPNLHAGDTAVAVAGGVHRYGRSCLAIVDRAAYIQSRVRNRASAFANQER